MVRLSIKKKLFLSFGALMAVMITGGIYELSHNSRLAERTSMIYSKPFTATRAALQAKADITAMHRSMKDVVLSSNEQEMNRHLALVGELENHALGQFDILTTSVIDSNAIALADRTKRDLIAWRQIRAKVVSFMKEGKAGEAVGVTKNEGAAHVQKLLAQIEDLWKHADADARSLIEESSKSVIDDSFHIAMMFLAGLIISFTLAAYVSGNIGGRLNQINEASAKIAVGEFDQTVEVRGADEIAQLADTFNLMSFSLMNLNKSLRDEIIESKKVRENLLLLEKAVEHAGETIVITDTNGVIEYVNPALEESTGYSREEVLGKTPKLFKSGAHGKDFYKGLWETIGSGDKWTGEIVNKRKDGSIYYDQTTISPVKNDSGQIVNYVAVKKDVTALRTALDNLKLREAALAKAQEITKVGHWEWNPAIDVFTCSPEIYKIFGVNLTASTLSISALMGMVHAEDRAIMEKSIRLLRDNGLPFSVEIRFIRPDGSELVSQCMGEAIKDALGDPVSLMGAIQDITETVLAQKALLRLKDQERELIREKEDLEKALAEQKSLTGWEQSVVTASLAGVGPLRERAPAGFEALKQMYGSLLDYYLEALGFKRSPPRAEISALAEKIGSMGGGPRDVIDMHIRVVSEKSADTHPKRARAYTVEGRLLALETMGYLVDFYRRKPYKTSSPSR